MLWADFLILHQLIPGKIHVGVKPIEISLEEVYNHSICFNAYKHLLHKYRVHLSLHAYNYGI